MFKRAMAFSGVVTMAVLAFECCIEIKFIKPADKSKDCLPVLSDPLRSVTPCL